MAPHAGNAATLQQEFISRWAHGPSYRIDKECEFAGIIVHSIPLL